MNAMKYNYAIVDMHGIDIISIHTSKPKSKSLPPNYRIVNCDQASFLDIQKFEQTGKELHWLNAVLVDDVLYLRETYARMVALHKRREQDDKIDEILSSTYDRDGESEAFRTFQGLMSEKREEALFRLAYRALKKANRVREEE